MCYFSLRKWGKRSLEMLQESLIIFASFKKPRHEYSYCNLKTEVILFYFKRTSI